MPQFDTTKLKSLLDTSASFAILIPKTPSYDVVSAALALKLALESQKKRVSVVCPDPITVEFNRLVGIDTITNTLGSKNLVIHFQEQSELVDTVSYDLDKGELRLVITPKSTAPKAIDYHQLKFSPAAEKVDHTITMGANVQTGLDIAGQIFSHPESSSLSELTAVLIDSLGIKFGEDIATNLYLGLTNATNNFQSKSVTPTTFEIAALLLSQGARRDPVISAADFPQGSIPQATPAPVTPTGYGLDHIPEESTPIQPSPAKPADWYEPKIYRGPMLQ